MDFRADASGLALAAILGRLIARLGRVLLQAGIQGILTGSYSDGSHRLEGYES